MKSFNDRKSCDIIASVCVGFLYKLKLNFLLNIETVRSKNKIKPI